jgi:argininosuccinate lyase
VRVQGLSFREAHSIVAAAVKSGDDSHGRIVDDVLSRLGAAAAASREELLRALDPVAFVEVRAIPGGPRPRRSRDGWGISTSPCLSWTGGLRIVRGGSRSADPCCMRRSRHIER